MKKKLSFYEFTQLSDEEQYDLLFREGEFLDSSTKKEVEFILYRLFSFFVEVIYFWESNMILNLNSFMKDKN